MSLQSGDVVWVAFPFVENEQVKARPALVISDPLGPGGNLAWTLMITNAQRAPWPGDVDIADLEAAGLPVASKVRVAKIATSEINQARKIGRLNEADHQRVRRELRCILPDL